MEAKLPVNFLWGNSTSSMQTEGGAHEGGKGPSVYDTYKATAETSDWDVAIDNYHHYEEDLDLMAQQGMNCYRFQISWSRVNPQGDGEFNEEGIRYYDNLINALLKRGIQPMICLYHFDMPLHLAKQYNGFLSRHVVDAFVRFGKEMIDRFSDRVKLWITFNEQNLYSQTEAFRIAGYLDGDRTDEELQRIAHHVMAAHAQVANYLHAHSNAKIGGMLAFVETYPHSSLPEDAFAARRIDEYLNRNLLDVWVNGHYSTEVSTYIERHHFDIDFTDQDRQEFAKLKSDFIAFSYYASNVVDATKIPAGTMPNRYLDYGAVDNPHLTATEWGWNIDPLGFRDVLTKTYNAYGVPMFPIENGIGHREEFHGQTIQDDYRIAYHRDHLRALMAAVNEDGVAVLGYLGWGLIDIPSSAGNMEKRYGMVYVNRGNHELRDLKRVPKKSYYWFAKVIKSNGTDLA
ncbi:glycoside hydrolase family 1 protein [Pediococcus acidilactici]